MNKDGIQIEELIPNALQVLAKSHSRDVKRSALSTLKALVTSHAQNKVNSAEILFSISLCLNGTVFYTYPCSKLPCILHSAYP